MTSGGPSAIATGTGGALRIAGLLAGRLTSWRLVISPTTGKPTLFGEGAFARFYIGATAGKAELIPTQQPARIGRKPPPKAQPFTLDGKIVELTPRSVVIAEGTIERRG